ncbi:12133_t:CDS:2 [Ambispora leptoticha]|uniref:12133_t:CDS:1 n=1 Tax=Ambispora leptoticha TaxID=144679 RepID=A0A9N9G6B8_9GLOM|nr:12133_t:CDS:2 [Ambispora leptoticha]
MSTLHLNAKDYWNKDMNRWNVNDWDIYIIKQDPKITKMQCHKLLSAELKRMKLKFTNDHPVYQRVERVQYMLKRIQKDKFNIRLWKNLKERNEKE